MENMITSLQNPKIKYAVKLWDARERRRSGSMLIEGCREIGLAIESLIKFENFFYCSELAGNKPDILSKIDNNIILQTTPEVFKKISYRENPDGFLAVAKAPSLPLDKIKLSSLPMVIVLESVEKPGNLGAILRSADAAGADAVLIADPKTDIYNPNVIRASQGTVFTKQVMAASSEKIIEWLKKNKIKSFAATPSAKKLYTEVKYDTGSAIVMGTEDKGLSDLWLKHSDEKIKIKMKGKIDSLNVSVSTAIILFEAIRQRIS